MQTLDYGYVTSLPKINVVMTSCACWDAFFGYNSIREDKALSLPLQGITAKSLQKTHGRADRYINFFVSQTDHQISLSFKENARYKALSQSLQDKAKCDY